MPTPDGIEPIADDELLFRRIPVSTGWHGPESDSPLSPEAFRPIRYDVTGISLYRGGEDYPSIEEVGRSQAGKRPGERRTFYVAVLRAGDLRKAGLEAVPRPRPDEPGHAEIPSLNYENRKTQRALETKNRLALELCLRVEGPFP